MIKVIDHQKCNFINSGYARYGYRQNRCKYRKTGTVTDKMVQLQIDTYIIDRYNYRQTCLLQTVTEQTGILQTSIFNRIFLVTFRLRQLQKRTDKDRQTGTLQQKSY